MPVAAPADPAVNLPQIPAAPAAQLPADTPKLPPGFPTAANAVPAVAVNPPAAADLVAPPPIVSAALALPPAGPSHHEGPDRSALSNISATSSFVVEPAPTPVAHAPRPEPSAPDLALPIAPVAQPLTSLPTPPPAAIVAPHQPGDTTGTNAEPTDEKPATRPLDTTATVDTPSTTAAQLPAPSVPPHSPSKTTQRADAPPADATSAYVLSAYARAEPPAQLAGIVAALARNGEGAHRLTLRLDPIELGHIEVVIDRKHGQPAAVTLTVERPETLLRLVRDQDQLARALDLAGLPAEDRKLRFQLATRDPARASDTDAPRSDTRPNQSQANDAAAPSLPQRQDSSADARRQNHGGQHHQASNRSPPTPGQGAPDPGIAAHIAEPSRHTPRLNGIDITA